ncbi:MAG: hypothetical protein HYV33_02310 [Candidatus Kerfeldbacteria bacterium]|nr:hypothetical protein [Candidatus Kerfeldbacteria bacterium]
MLKGVLAELFIDHSESDRSVIHVFISQPSPLEEKNLGRAFALIEFTEPQPFYAELVDRLDQAFNLGYYHSTDFAVEAAFERTMQKLNKVVQQAITDFGEAWAYHTNAVFGVIHNNDIHLSYVGTVGAWLVRSDKMLDIIQAPANSEIKPLKLFSNIISGQCPERSGILLATANILDYLSLEKIRRIVGEHAPDESVRVFEDTLSESNTLSNIAGIIIKLEKPTRAETDATSIDELDRSEFNQRQDSMQHLINQERTTGELLAPSIWPSLKKRFQTLTTAKPQIIDTRRSSMNYVRSQSPASKTLRMVGEFLKNVAIQTIVGTGYVLKKLLQWWRRRQPGDFNIKRRWQKLTGPRKILVVVASVIFVVFIIMVLRQDTAVEQQQTTSQFEQTVAEVEQYLGEAESKQIMKDEAGARNLINQADTALATIPTDSEIYQTKGQSLRQRIDDVLNVYNKVTVLTDVQPTGDFGTAGSNVTVGQITKIGNNIFGFDRSTGSVYRLNLENTTVSQSITDDTTDQTFVTVENDSAATALALLTDDSVVQFNPVLEKNSPVTITLPATADIIDFDIFGSRLYSLDIANNQIYRQQKSGDSYGNASDWLTETADISQAVAFDIDGSIYVLQNDGAILKFDGGTASDFTVPEFNPSLNGSTKLIKSSPTAPFVIMNPATQRLVILDSEANLTKQLTSDRFNDLRDVAYDEDTNTAYVLSGNSLYTVGL